MSEGTRVASFSMPRGNRPGTKRVDVHLPMTIPVSEISQEEVAEALCRRFFNSNELLEEWMHRFYGSKPTYHSMAPYCAEP